MKREHVMRLERAVLGAQRWVNFRGSHHFVDRSCGSDRLVLVLAGYKPYLWDLTLSRLERFLPADADVCVVSPGVRRPALDNLTERLGWSYLATSANYPSLAQNLAIGEHGHARWIFKVDEDIFITEGFCERLLAAWGRVEEDASYRPGLVAPLLNVNGYAYVAFLEALGLQEDYRERFGALTHAAGQIPATEDGQVALWLWQRSLPLDEVAKRLASVPARYSTVPHKFSIGAILIERAFWEFIGGLKVRPFVGGIGVDEQHLCTMCLTFSRAMVIAHDVFAGHFSFGAQEEAMRAALPDLRPGLLLASTDPAPGGSQHGERPALR